MLHRHQLNCPAEILRRLRLALTRHETIGNIGEPIVTIDEHNRRLVWSAVGGSLTHYNASAQVFMESDGSSRVVWIADLLPDDAARSVEGMMDAGMAAMKAALDRLAH